MKIIKPFPLSEYITLDMVGSSKLGVIVSNADDLKEAVDFAKKQKLPITIIGNGSNITIPEYLDALVVKIQSTEKLIEKNVLIANAGVDWDDLVKFSLIKKLYGLENMSGIPGTVGGAVFQNIGAYGVEICNFVKWIEVLDIQSMNIIKLKPKDCKFGYRDSIFKKNRYLIITRVALNLNEKFTPVLRYKALCKLSTGIDAEDLREHILDIRRYKFENGKTAGSFFKNIEVNESEIDNFRSKFSGIPVYKIGKKAKIPLAWMLDNICNLCGFSSKGIELSQTNPIVLVTKKRVKSEDLYRFINKVRGIVRGKIGIDIEEEVQPIKTIDL